MANSLDRNDHRNRHTYAKIKDRIRKLLALSSSPHEAEAAAALAKAHELLLRHGLTMSEISTGESGIRELTVVIKASIDPWEEKLLKCILSATFTEALKTSGDNEEELIIIGREANIVTAKILYEYLHETIVRKCTTFSGSIEDLESFRIGMVDSLDRKFQDRNKGLRTAAISKEMIVALEHERSSENRRYIEEQYGKPDTSGTWYGVDPNSYGLGKAIGKKISINPQLFSKKGDLGGAAP